MDLAGISGPKQAEQYGVGVLCGSVSGAYRTFQTVSLRSSRKFVVRARIVKTLLRGL